MDLRPPLPPLPPLSRALWQRCKGPPPAPGPGASGSEKKRCRRPRRKPTAKKCKPDLVHKGDNPRLPKVLFRLDYKTIRTLPACDRHASFSG